MSSEEIWTQRRTHRDDGHVTTKAEGAVMCPPATQRSGRPATPRSGRRWGRTCPSGSKEARHDARHAESRLGEIRAAVFSHPVRGAWSQQRRTPVQQPLSENRLVGGGLTIKKNGLLWHPYPEDFLLANRYPGRLLRNPYGENTTISPEPWGLHDIKHTLS